MTLGTRTDSRNTFELYDQSVGYDDEGGIKFTPGLSEFDRRRATVIYRLFTPPREVTGLWGLCVVYGPPGAGKDCFGNWLSYTLKRYFPQKRILRDEPPRELYGPYGGLFNESVLQDDFEKMRQIGKGLKIEELDNALDKVADDWVKGAGEVMLKNSVLYLTEFWKYVPKREPHKPMNRTMGAIHKVKRHLDCFIIGTIQTVDDLDRFTAKPYIDWMVTCTKSTSVLAGFVYYIQRVTYDKRKDMLIPIGQPFPMPLDGGKPRNELDGGKIILRKPRYQPETEEERVVLEALKAGIDNYDDLVKVIEDAGDMTEKEILDTVKTLGLKLPGRRTKFVIDYGCYLKIYNSKSAPQLKTSVRMED